MAYNFNKSDGVSPVTIADGAINTTDFSIPLLGNGVTGYGAAVAQAFVHMLENFASSAPPANPTTGQIWFNTSSQAMNYWNGSAWVALSASGGSLTGNLLPSADCVGSVGSNVGSPALRFCNMYAVTFHGDLNGTATTAKYSDLAERFEADKHYEPGTVVMLGGDKEITETTEEYSFDVFGVVSEFPAHLMNASAGDDTTHPPVAFAGRVPVKIDGPVTKGQRLVSSGVNGKAKGYTGHGYPSPFAVIGRALEDSHGDTVMVVVGAK